MPTQTMSRLCRATVVFCLVASIEMRSAIASGPAPPQLRTVLIMPMEPKSGVSRDLADQMSTLVTAEAGRAPGFKVIAFKEVETAMSAEQARQLQNCDQASCASEIAGAMNSDEVVIGSLGQVGNSYVLTLTRIRAKDAAVAARVVERFPGLQQDAILDRLPRCVANLFGNAGTPPGPLQTTTADTDRILPPENRAPGQGRPWLAYLAFGVVGVAAVGALAAVVIAAASGGLLVADRVLAPPGWHLLTQSQAVASDAGLVIGLSAAAFSLVLAIGAGFVGALGWLR